MTLSQLDAIGFGAGPGAFTGVRLAASITQAIAFAHDLPVAAISSLAALAQGAYRQFGVSHCVASLDARMQEVYWGLYQADSNGLMCAIVDDQVCLPEQVTLAEAHRQQQWHGIGSGFDAYPDVLIPRLQSQLNVPSMPWSANRLPQAHDVALLTKARALAKRLVPPHEALPKYVRNQVVKKHSS